MFGGAEQGAVVKALFESRGAPYDWPVSTPVWAAVLPGTRQWEGREGDLPPVPNPLDSLAFLAFEAGAIIMGGGVYRAVWGRSVGRREVK